MRLRGYHRLYTSARDAKVVKALAMKAPAIALDRKRAPVALDQADQVFTTQSGIQTRSRRLQKEQDIRDIAGEDFDYVESEDDDEEFQPGIRAGKKRPKSKALKMTLDKTVKTMEVTLPPKRTNQSAWWK
jgi:hypothetical protein